MSELSYQQLDALDRIQQKPALQLPFFRKISGTKWFMPLKQRGFFTSPRALASAPLGAEASSVRSAWPVLLYLERVAPELQNVSSRTIALAYVEVMRNVTGFAIKEGSSDDRIWWTFAKALAFLPVELLVKSDLQYIVYWLSDSNSGPLVATTLGLKVLPRLLAAGTEGSREIALGLVQALATVRAEQRRGTREKDRTATLAMDAFHAHKVFNENAKPIGAILERQGIEVFQSSLVQVLEITDRDRYSTIWRPAIDDHPQNHRFQETLDVLIDAFRDSLTGYVEKKATAATPYLTELLASDWQVIKRTAIHVVGQHGVDLRNLFSKVLLKENFSPHFQHEIFHFIRKSLPLFEESERRLLFDIIEEAGKHAELRDGEPEPVRASYERLEWLSAIQGLGNEEADSLYANNLAIVGAAPEHPDFASYHSSAEWVGEISPYAPEELVSREFADLIDILVHFKEERGWKVPTRRGLAQALRKALVLNPKYFNGRLGSLLTLDMDYIHELLVGYGELWKDKKYDNWKELLEFCTSLLSAPAFWLSIDEQEHDTVTLRATRSWVVGQIADLIRAGTVSDETAFSEELLPHAGFLLTIILENQESAAFSKPTDAMGTAINSARGRAVEALMNYALRCCRLADRRSEAGDHATVWKTELLPLFSREMERVRVANLEFVTLFGTYIGNLLYMNRQWTMGQLPRIFDKTDRTKWLCAMDGYGYNGIVFDEIYSFLSGGGDFKAALMDEDLDRQARTKVIQNIVVAYFQDHEDLSDSQGLLKWLIKKGSQEDISDMIWFVWTLRGSDPIPIEKIMRLWQELSDGVDMSTKAGRAVLSRMSTWSVFLRTIDPIAMSLLIKLAPFAEDDYNAYVLVEELRRLVDVCPEEVAQVFLEIMKGTAPIFEQEHIEYTLTKLYEHGLGTRDQVNAIVDSYAERGIEFPAAIRARYH